MIKRSVFGSRGEKELFTSLHSHWGSRFDLWPSLPLAQIIDIKSAGGYLKGKERDFFLKTNVDYTLCTKNGRPILSVEFDGLGKGFSRRGEYLQQEPTIDPHRKLKLDLKLRVAKKEEYPFFVVSFEESKVLDQDTNLTIVDGIIGQVLAKQELQESLKTLYDDHRERIESLPLGSRHDYIQELVLDAETLAELEWDPIAIAAAKCSYEAFEKGIVKSYRTEYLNDPELPDGDPFTDIAVIEKRIAAMQNAIRVGCRIIADTPKVAIIETVWLRNFEETAVSPLHIAVNIAELLVFKRALDLATD
jgi:hypothetical protein